METPDGFVCDRCYKPSRIRMTSYFNTDECCVACIEKERHHQDYEVAKQIEAEHVRQGDLNFPGVGKPSDL